MRKIVIFAPSIYTHGGEQRVITVIANELSKDHDVTIFTCDKAKVKHQVYPIDKRIQVKHYYPYSKHIILRLCRYLYRKQWGDLYRKFPILVKVAFYDPSSIKKMTRIIDGNYDVAIAVSGNLSILLGYASRSLKNTVTIGWEHNSYEAYFETPRMYYWYKKNCFMESVRCLDKCVVLNEDIALKYEQKLRIPCEVVYNPRSFVSEEKSQLSNPTFIACGRFVPQKGFDLLIQSFAEFAKVDKEWKLYVVGDGPMRPTLEQMIRDYGITDRVVLTGYTDQVKELLLDSSIYLLSSRWEGFPMCVTEAFEVGLPVISFDISAVMPLIKQNEGILVKSFDTFQFTDAMLKLSHSFESRKRMSDFAIQMADSISVEKIGEKWRNLFR